MVIRYLAWMNPNTPPAGSKVRYWFNPDTDEWKEWNGTGWEECYAPGVKKGDNEVITLPEGKMTFKKGILTKWEPA